VTLNTVYQAVQNNVVSLAQWTQDQFAALAAGIAAGWNTEHDGEGHHTAITAASATVAGPVRANQFSIGATIYPDILSADVTSVWITPGSETAGAIFVRSSGGVTIYGLSTQGRQEGDVIAFINGNQSVDGIALRTNATTLAAAAGTFRADGSIPDTDYTIPCGRWVWLIVSRISPNNPNAKLYWRISHF
jgi:hypothetical protein